MASRIRVPRDFRPLIARALDEGWTLHRRPCGHLKLEPPDGAGSGPVFFASSPSDHRARHQFRRDLKRAGLPV